VDEWTAYRHGRHQRPIDLGAATVVNGGGRLPPLEQVPLVPTVSTPRDEGDASPGVYPLGNSLHHLTFVLFYVVKIDRNDGF